MAYLSLKFYVFVGILLGVYYILPLRYRGWVLLAGSLGFYGRVSKESWWVMGVVLAASFFMGMLLEDGRGRGTGRGKRLAAAAAVGIAAVPLIVVKNGNFLLHVLADKGPVDWIVPIGMSFYTLQIISYVVDVSRGTIRAERNPGKYALFICFFPQIIQGPIPRYGQLAGQLWEGHRFDEREFVKGIWLILWGFFLKLMIADRAGTAVNTIFSGWEAYQGFYVLVGGGLYGIELYGDFLSCVCLAKGTAQLFGITLADNFLHPYMARSVKEFWGRWHLSLSSWLKDYIYIPLGGNRRGTLRRYGNILATFAVSGVWHGAGYKYIFWGLMHGVYQIAGDLTKGVRDRICRILGMEADNRVRVWTERAFTWFWVTAAWVIFRAGGLKQGLFMVRSMVMVYNPWIFFDDSLLSLGLSWKEWVILGCSVMVLMKAEKAQEKGCIRDALLKQPLIVRWGATLGAAAVIMVFGSYGYGFSASDFIYGRF